MRDAILIKQDPKSINLNFNFINIRQIIYIKNKKNNETKKYTLIREGADHSCGYSVNQNFPSPINIFFCN